MNTPTEQPPICFACQQPMQPNKEHVCREREQPPVDLEGLRELYESYGLQTIDCLKGPISFLQKGKQKILTNSEMRFMEMLHNAFPSILSELTNDRQRIGELEGLLAEAAMDRSLIEHLQRGEADTARQRDEARASLALWEGFSKEQSATITSQFATIERMRNRLQRVEAAAGKALRLSDPEQDVEVILGELQEALLPDDIRAALTQPPQGEEVRVTNIQVCHLPYQTSPFVFGHRNGKSVWLRRDGTWSETDGDPECSLKLGGWELPNQREEVREETKCQTCGACLGVRKRDDEKWICENCKSVWPCLQEEVRKDGWQPIETAPKDGTEIILYAPEYPWRDAPCVGQNTSIVPERITSGQWLEYEDPDDEEHDQHGWTSLDGGFTNEHPPTHWQPLPAAPSTSEAEGK